MWPANRTWLWKAPSSTTECAAEYFAALAMSGTRRFVTEYRFRHCPDPAQMGQG
jgi:hypothetical protein